MAVGSFFTLVFFYVPLKATAAGSTACDWSVCHRIWLSWSQLRAGG